MRNPSTLIRVSNNLKKQLNALIKREGSIRSAAARLGVCDSNLRYWLDGGGMTKKACARIRHILVATAETSGTRKNCVEIDGRFIHRVRDLCRRHGSVMKAAKKIGISARGVHLWLAGNVATVTKEAKAKVEKASVVRAAAINGKRVKINTGIVRRPGPDRSAIDRSVVTPARRAVSTVTIYCAHCGKPAGEVSVNHRP